jgi:hypothetical protein
MPSVSHLPRLQSLTTANAAAEIARAKLGASLTPNDAKWVNEVAAKFGGDPAVKAALAKLIDSASIADTSSIGGALTAIGRSATTTAPVATGGASTTVSVQAGGGVKPQNVNSLDVVHFKGPSTYEGDFKLKADALTNNYAGVPADKFGTTTVNMPGGASYVVHDMQYDLDDDGKVGMRFVPVADAGGTVVDKDGKTVPAGAIVDAYIRERAGLKPDEPIYALINYIHPETWSGDLSDLAQNKLKTEMASTHLGAYWGDAKTTNSPEEYHNHTFEVTEGDTGYPCNVNLVSMDGVPQALLNKNLRLADGTMNHGVEFPGDYKNDVVRTVDMPTTMMFYRDWIMGADYLHNDRSWFTYCAEHKTLAVNVGLNLPHNLAAFKEMFGDDGEKVWNAFKDKFKKDEGRDFTAADETSFEPLWKKEGLKLEDARPWKDKAEYDAYQAARQAGTLASYTGRVPPEPGKGLAWPPETTSDLLNDFITTYANFEQAGAFVGAASMLGFKDQITQRMGISDDKFLAMTVPVVNKMLIAEAMVTAPGQSADAWMKMASATLLGALGGNAQLQPLVDQCLQGVKAQINNIVAQPVPADAAQARAAAHQWLRDAVQVDVEKARRVAVSDASKVEFNSPPAVVNRVAIGMHESSKFVHITTICTCIAAEHLEPK